MQSQLKEDFVFTNNHFLENGCLKLRLNAWVTFINFKTNKIVNEII